MANDTEYGLISYVYAKDPGAGIKVARQHGVRNGRYQPRPRV